ncbi:AfsR/SARP family transcriptional regulator [Umezawaea tangerina]|uniref:DNA-binding SARP family transcriptional activator n=1 Tax=Umezawaea tangerina TaxID=84725 RepID=A0A2T0TGG7_9PSEU|nr:BTAD domain-containing putative transcriptional regulator [Umezawaea tangerina]PRY44786.1 DNA-binding SARP family transcriptional activator [Umezawaea tangerina]
MEPERGRWTLGVLGPLQAAVDGRVVAELGGPRLRVVLALLGANTGRPVSVVALVEALWGEHAPSDAARTTRTYVSRLRRTLLRADEGADDLIETRPPGYALRWDPDTVDSVRFERLAVAGRQALDAGLPTVATDRLTAALGMWRGEAYGEFAHVTALQAEGERLERLRLTAVQDRIDADLATGMGEALIAELEGLIGRHPAHERLWGQLMTALYRAGRQADALKAFRRAREVLAEEAGLEPSPGLIEIQRRVLAQDARLLPDHTPAPAVAPATRPAQLPPAVRTFAGRDRELADLDAVLPAASGPAGVVVVSGTAGVGKTALAVHWAHRVADRFPDGQFYVDLRGFDPAGASALHPSDALRGFLEALGVPVAGLPVEQDGLSGRYRSALAGKRVLVVLDNAGDVGQVRPLLPGSPGCLVVVTSRHELTPLVAVEGAHPLFLDLLPAAEARDLLARRLGRDRVVGEPAAVEAIIAGCARLPLALAVVAARAASRPAFRLAAVAAQLRDAAGVLDALRGGDRTTDVRAVFSWSYRALSPSAARLFRLLGLHPGPDVGTAAAASLAGVAERRAREQLDELATANLLTEHAPGRYTSHDLLRAYATELVDADDRPTAALHRLLEHYLHTARTAALLLHPHRVRPLTQGPPGPGVTTVRLTDVGRALAWFTAEHPVLLTAVDQAVAGGSDTHAYQLAWSLATYLERQGHWHDLAATQHTAVGAARRLGDRAAEAHARGSLAGADVRLGRFPDAHTHLRYALDLFALLGDRAGQAHTHLDLGWTFERQARHTHALHHAEHALELFRATGDRDGEARALNQVGWCHAQLDDHQQALTRCRQALALHQELGDRAGEAHTWDSLGYAYHHLGSHTRATHCYHRALDLFRVLGDRYNEAGTLTHLGDIHADAGDHATAHTTWHLALSILGELDRPTTTPVTQLPIRHTATPQPAFVDPPAC